MSQIYTHGVKNGRVAKVQNVLDILETQREGFVRELGSAPTEDIRKAFQAEIDAVDAKIAAENARRAEEEQKVNEVAQDFSNALDTITIGGMTFTIRELTKGEEEAQIVRAAIINMGTENAQKFLREIAAVKAESADKLAAKDAVINTLNAEADELKKANDELADTFDGLSASNNALKEQLEEAQKEVARLNSHVDDLRGQIALGNARPVIDITSEVDLEVVARRLRDKKDAEAKAAEEAKQAAKPRIYNVRPADALGRNNLANLAATGEEITIPYLEMYKYVVLVDQAEVERFRAEQPAVQVEEDTPNDSPLVVEAPAVESPFRPNEESPRNDGEGISEGANPAGLSLAEKVEAHEKRLKAIEDRLGISA